MQHFFPKEEDVDPNVFAIFISKLLCIQIFFLPLVVLDKLVFKLKEVTNMYKGDAYLSSILFTIMMIQSRFFGCKLNRSVAKMSTP
jgi:hypothetical protein